MKGQDGVRLLPNDRARSNDRLDEHKDKCEKREDFHIDPMFDRDERPNGERNDEKTFDSGDYPVTVFDHRFNAWVGWD